MADNEGARNAHPILVFVVIGLFGVILFAVVVGCFVLYRARRRRRQQNFAAQGAQPWAGTVAGPSMPGFARDGTGVPANDGSAGHLLEHYTPKGQQTTGIVAQQEIPEQHANPPPAHTGYRYA